MSTETILNILVALMAVNSIATARFNVAERRARYAEHGASYGVTAGLTAFASLALWVWLAFHTGHWQFAAIVAVPMLITLGSLASRPKANS